MSDQHVDAEFHTLVETHRTELRAHCQRMLGSADDAEDAVQDALLRAWRATGRFEGRSSRRTWLYRIATNACLDVIAARGRRPPTVELGPAADAVEAALQVWSRRASGPKGPVPNHPGSS